MTMQPCLDSGCGTAWFEQGSSLPATSTPDTEAALRRALRLSPEDPQAWHRVGACLDRSGKTRESLEYFEQALVLDPAHTASLLSMGCAYLHLRQPYDALPLLLRVSLARPDGFESSYNLACAYALLGETQSGLDHLRRAIRQAPFDIRPHVRGDADLAPLREHPGYGIAVR